MAHRGGGRDHADMPHFLVEIHMADASEPELERAVRMLEGALRRSSAATSATRPISAGITRGDGRLICLIDAATLAAARRIVAVALLPPGRIREIVEIPSGGLLGARHPGGDVHARAEAELVEDVVDVGLDGPLGQE
jgi:hypothetical protein